MIDSEMTSPVARHVPWIVLLASVVIAGGCASTGAVPRPFPLPSGATAKAPQKPPPAPPAVSSAPSPAVTTERPSSADDPHAELPIVATALGLLGSPYRNGGATPDGFDCSGFTQWVFARHGVPLPRETRLQFTEGTEVHTGEISAGDLIFFSTVARGPSHVGIALDKDRFVHAPSSRGVVRIERRSSTYWSRRYLGARRIADLDE